MTDDQNMLKRQAAEYAVEFIQSGMIVGLGHGSTTIWAVRRLAEKIHAGQLSNIQGVPVSVVVEQEALQVGIPLTTLDRHPVVDLTIDGADEVDPALNLIKGGGGALLREKIVAQASKREIIVIDESKLSPHLGTQWAVPVEVVSFGHAVHREFLTGIGAKTQLRMKDGELFVTDQGNVIYDCNFGPLHDPVDIASKLKARTGIVEHGLFINLASDVIVARPKGIEHLKRGG